MQFTLNASFTNDQLNWIYAAGSNVIIAKPSADGSNPNVAWLVFKPLQANTATWQEEYGIYCSTQQIQNGAVLTQLSSVPVPAVENKLYTLQQSGVIAGPSNGGTQDSFSLLNQYGNVPMMTVGLYQDATVNGTNIMNSAVSAAPVLLQSTAVMTPYTTVYIWLQSNIISNTVVTTVTSPMTELKFGGGTDKISVAYDSQSGTFIPSQTQDGKGSIKIKTVEALLY